MSTTRSVHDMRENPFETLMELYPMLFKYGERGSGDASEVFFVDSLKGLLTPEKLHIEVVGSADFDLEFCIISEAKYNGNITIFSELDMGINLVIDLDNNMINVQSCGVLYLKHYSGGIEDDLSTIIPEEVCVSLFELGIDIKYTENSYAPDGKYIGKVTKMYDRVSILRRHTLKGILS